MVVLRPNLLKQNLQLGICGGVALSDRRWIKVIASPKWHTFEKDEYVTEIYKKLVNCDFDIASVISGHVCGVQARIKQKQPAVVYTHCIAHRLELYVLYPIKCDNYSKEFDEGTSNIFQFYFYPFARRREFHENAMVLKDEFNQLGRPKNICWIASRHSGLTVIL